jgi:hypothetical protein
MDFLLCYLEPTMQLIEIWRSLRGLITDNFTFNTIKDLAAASGLPMAQEAHLQQGRLPGPTMSKSELADAIAGLFEGQGDPNRSAEYFIQEMLRRKPSLRQPIDELLHRFGWYLDAQTPCRMDLQCDLGTKDLGEEVQNALSLCFRRYRDGDYSGAVTAICGVLDSVTEKVYAQKQLGNPHDDSYQQRINRAFSSCQKDFESSFADVPGINADDLRRIWNNYRGSMNQAAYVLGSFRRHISDAHGTENCTSELVQKALDCATFILRSIHPYL